MFSIDFPEVVIIFGIALVVLGPKKLPGAVAKIGRWVGRARTMARQFREQLEQEVASAENALDIRKTLDSVTSDPPQQSSAATGGADHDPAAAHEAAIAPEPVAASEPPATPEPTAVHEPTFDSQLYDTAVPPDPAPAAHSDSPDPGMQAWMPETQTWMAGVGWEMPEGPTPEEAAPQAPAAERAPRPPEAQVAAPSKSHPPASAAAPSSAEAIEHGER